MKPHSSQNAPGAFTFETVGDAVYAALALRAGIA